MHLIRVAERLGASSRRPRHPLPVLMAGVNPGPVPVHRALQALRRHNSRLFMITGTCEIIDELRHVIDHTAPVVAHNGHVNDLVQKNSTSCNRGSSAVSSQLRTNMQDLHSKRRSPCQ